LRDIARAVRAADNDLALFDIHTMNELAATAISKRTFQTWFVNVFGVIALLLAATGIFAVTAQFVAQRAREFGIRIALGASAGHIVHASTRQTARLAVIGLAGGIAGSVAATRLLGSLLFATSSMDPFVLFAVSALLAVVTVLATYGPTRRALRVNPVEALRNE
jgi:putative ABC transport system permease protein